MTIGLRVGIFLTLAACGGAAASSPADAGPAADGAALPPAVGAFPAGFLWGTAIAPYQVEGGLHATDWYAWESLCRACSGDHADDGPDFWDHYAEDLDAAAALGTNAIRLGIEWGRVFPTRDSFPASPDAAAVARYHAILAAARARGLRPMVTLHHFSTPIWLSDPAHPDTRPGWEDPGTAPLFAEWARFCAREFGGEVDWWITINEPLAYIAGGWIGGGFPPGKSGDINGALAVADHLVHGAALAYDAIHAEDRIDADGDGQAAWVSFATHNRVFLPRTPADAAAADRLRRLNNLMFLDALAYGNIDRNLDGDFDDPGDVSADPQLAGRLDFIGLNYYGVSLVEAVAALDPYALPLMNDLDRYGLDAPVTDLGPVIYPQGFRVVLDELVPYQLPIVVTENGLADADDDQRPRFLVDHLYALAAAIDDGIDVRGYFHWSLIDNFEWVSGFCPRFGLVHVDFTDPARPRTPGEGAAVYREIIEANTVPVDLFRRYPGYPGPDLYCRRTGL